MRWSPVLIESNGSVNEKGIDEYITKNDVDAPYENRDSEYHNKPPLYIAISCTEINGDIKVKLVSYLIKNYAKVSDAVNYINMALYNQNFELADLLLQKGASVLRTS